MTQAQKTAKANFKKAIEYRKKTGVSLKEAFAHVYGKKVGAVKKKAAPKRKAAVKKAVPKKKPVKRGAKTKVLKPIKQRGTSVKSYDKRHQALPSGKRKTAWGTTYYESRANRSDKGALLGIGELPKEFSMQQAQQYATMRNKPTKFYFNVFGWQTYYTLKPTFATPTGKAKGFPRIIIFKP
jgi:hypothetical protein